MKLHEALRKVIRHFGVNVIEEKRLMSFLADYKAFDDYPAVKEVMKCIATGDSGKKICLAADGSDEEFLRIASEIRETLVREKSFKEEFARYAVDSVSFALGIVPDVTEPQDHGYEAVQKNTGNNGSAAAQYIWSRPEGWQKASDGAKSHRRFYRGKDLTTAFDSGEFSKNVADGTFRDIFPGDYIIKEVSVPDIKDSDGNVYIAGKTYGIKFIIADLDYALNCENSGVTNHHVVILPETPPFRSCMNPAYTTENGCVESSNVKGGYTMSYMNKIVIPAFSLGLASAFGSSHLLKFCIDVSKKGSPDWQFSTCRLMTLAMFFGQEKPDPWDGFPESRSEFYEDRECPFSTQLAVFRPQYGVEGPETCWVLHSFRDKEMCFWLSDIRLNYDFAIIKATTYDGLYMRPLGRSFAHIDSKSTSDSAGVRPFALLV